MTNIAGTHFDSVGARFKRDFIIDHEQLLADFFDTTAERKDMLPWIKLAVFGMVTSRKGSLRHDANVEAITGVEGDYDREMMSFEAAVDLLKTAKVFAIIYTSPSHTPQKPRWRVLCPFDRRLPSAERYKMVARLNGILGGVLSVESFTLSQSYYWGHLNNGHEQAQKIEGDFLCDRGDLDAIAIGKTGGKQKTNSSGNGHDGYVRDHVGTDDLVRLIVSGESLHPVVAMLAGRFAKSGVPRDACKDFISGAFEAANADRYTDARHRESMETIDFVFDKETNKQKDAGTEYQLLWARTDKGSPLPTLENALITLRNDEQLKYRFAFDQMLRSPMIQRPEGLQQLSDDDISDVQEYMQKVGLKRISRDTVRQAILSFCGDQPFHPLRTYLDSLPWDGTPRLHLFASKYLGAEANAYNAAVGKFFLISMIARIYKPGCKVDYMLVLEGPQGTRKSMACRLLFGDCYFSDNLPEIGSGKDVSVHLRGKWGIEISEMHAFNKAESSHLKSFVTRQSERYRPPYGSLEVDEPRQCVFIGTTNKDTYLKDETGGRRFWPILTGTIDIAALRGDRHQILAEAVTRFRAGEPWWPEPDFEQKIIAAEQEKRFDQDVWFQTIATYLDTITVDRISVASLARGALNMSDAYIGRSEQMRLTSILKELKWTLEHTRSGNIWVRPGVRT